MDVMVGDYCSVPVPDLDHLQIESEAIKLKERYPLKYFEEIAQPDRKQLDLAVLKAVGFSNPEDALVCLYDTFVEVTEDRLSKGRENEMSNSGALVKNKK